MPDTTLESFQHEVEDATMLLEFAVANGFKTDDNRKVSDEVIDAIKKAEDLLSQGTTPAAADRAAFEKAYRDLSLLLAPVNAGSLRATSPAHGTSSWIVFYLTKLPEATILFWKLVFWTCVFVLISLAGNLFNPADQVAIPPAISGMRGFEFVRRLLEILEPFTYGGIGACAYLLKSCITYIQRREFDTRRTLEYFSRMVLGVVAGGVIVLLVAELQGTDGTAIRISAKTLGVLAGYNTDFLFSAIERLTAAILPKINVESTLRQAPRTAVTVGDVSLKDLLAQLQATTDPTQRALLQAIIDRIKDRI